MHYGGDYMSKNFDEFLKIQGVVRQTSTPFTPQQNTVAKRTNCTIVEMVRNMLHAQHLGHEYWTEAMVTLVYTRIRCLISVLTSMTPQEVWSRKKPYVSHIMIFECIAYAKVSDCMRSKFDTKNINVYLLAIVKV